jgi:hypothetical protein
VLTQPHTLRFEAAPDVAPLGPTGEVTPDTGDTGQVPNELEAALGELGDVGGQPEGDQADLTLEGLAHALAERDEILGEMYEYLVQQREAFQTPPAVADTPPEPPRWDPMDPEGVGNYLNHTFGQMLDERLAPLMPLMETFAESQGEQVANQQFDQIEQQIGAFDRAQALDRALWMIESASIPPQQAIQYAAQEQRQFEEKIRQEAVAAYEQRVAGALGAEGDIPAGGAGAERDEPLPYGRGNSRQVYREAARRSLARQNLRAVQ